MFRLQILDRASRELGGLEQPVARRVVRRIRWLAANLEAVKLEALSGDLAGFFKVRVGDYRVVYEVLWTERTIVIHAIGHRRDVYRSR